MKAIIIAALLALCSSCGPDQEIDADLEPMLNLYLMHAPTSGQLDNLVELKFGSPPEGKDGYCFKRSNKTVAGKPVPDSGERRIVIKPAEFTCRWRALVLHELGHCLHDLEHSDDPLAIMNPRRQPAELEQFWCDNLEAKLQEMFR